MSNWVHWDGNNSTSKPAKNMTNNNNNNNKSSDPTLQARLFGSERVNRKFLPWNKDTGVSISNTIPPVEESQSPPPNVDEAPIVTTPTNSNSDAKLVGGSASSNKLTCNQSSHISPAVNNSTAHKIQESKASTSGAPPSLLSSIFGGGGGVVESDTPAVSAPHSPVPTAEAGSIHPSEPNRQQSLFEVSNPQQWQQLIAQRRGEVSAKMQQQQQQQHQHHTSAAEDGSGPPAIMQSASAASNTSLSPHNVLERRSKRLNASQALTEKITVPIPKEFVTLPVTPTSTSSPAPLTPTNTIVAPPSDPDHQEDNDPHAAQDIQAGILRTFTGRADYVLRQNGVLLIKKQSSGMIFPRKLLTSLRQSAASIQQEVLDRLQKDGEVWTSDNHNFSYHEVASRCVGRLDIRHRMDEAPFNLPEVVENPWLMPLIHSLLGPSAKLVYCGLILSFPGSADQPWHQDGHALFPEEEMDRDLPPYALNVFVPVIPIDMALGPTEFWLGSHRESQLRCIQSALEASNNGCQHGQGNGHAHSDHSVSSSSGDEGDKPIKAMEDSIVAPMMSKGDVMIYDYRTCHRGVANVSQTTVRPMLYLMYARPWFVEHVNFGTERLFPKREADSSEAPDAKRNKVA